MQQYEVSIFWWTAMATARGHRLLSMSMPCIRDSDPKGLRVRDHLEADKVRDVLEVYCHAPKSVSSYELINNT